MGDHRNASRVLAWLSLALLVAVFVAGCSGRDDSGDESVSPNGTVPGEVTAQAHEVSGNQITSAPSAVVVTLEGGEEVLAPLGGAAIGGVDDWFQAPLQEGQPVVGHEDLVGGGNVEMKEAADGTWEIVSVVDGG